MKDRDWHIDHISALWSAVAINFKPLICNKADAQMSSNNKSFLLGRSWNRLLPSALHARALARAHTVYSTLKLKPRIRELLDRTVKQRPDGCSHSERCCHVLHNTAQSGLHVSETSLHHESIFSPFGNSVLKWTECLVAPSPPLCLLKHAYCPYANISWRCR